MLKTWEWSAVTITRVSLSSVISMAGTGTQSASPEASHEETTAKGRSTMSGSNFLSSNTNNNNNQFNQTQQQYQRQNNF